MPSRPQPGAVLALAAFFAAAPARPAQPAAPAREIECALLVRFGTMIEGVPAPGLHLLNRTAADPPFSATLSTNVVRVGCRRTIIVPGPHDDVVATRGIPLTIVEEGSGRVLVLDLAGGRFRYRMESGSLTADEAALATLRLAEFQARRQPTPR